MIFHTFRAMTHNLTKFILSLSWAKVCSALVLAKRPLCLRELVDLSGLSLAGVQDVVRRLTEQNILSKEKQGNKVLFSLSLNKTEQKFLNQLIEINSSEHLLERSVVISKRKKNAIDWIDETIAVLQKSNTQTKKRLANDAT